MEKMKGSETILLILSGILAYMGMLYQYFVHAYHLIYPYSWTYSFLGMGVFLMLLQILSAVIPNVRLRQFPLLLRMGIVLVLMIPERSRGASFCFVLGIMMFEVFACFDGWTGGLLVVLLLLAEMFISRSPFTFWNQEAEVCGNGELFELMSGTVIFSVFGAYWARCRRHYGGTLEENEKLQAVNEMLVLSNTRLQASIVSGQREALETERTRIARELHDTLSSTLVSSLSLLDTYRLTHREEERAEDPIGTASRLIRSCFVDIRKILSELRKRERSPQDDGFSGIRYVIELFRETTGVKIDVKYNVVRAEISNELSRILYRIVQEGITNAIRHGKASEIRISFRESNHGIQLTICDNGLGAKQIENGFGLIGIQERIKLYQGSLFVHSEPGNGFVLNAWLPFSK